MLTMTNSATALARRLLIAFEAGDEDVVDDVIHPDHVDRARADGPAGPEAVRQSIRAVRETFGDRHLVIKELFAPDDRIVARVLFSATRVGEFYGIAPIGRRVESERIHVWRVADRRLIEHWVICDHLLEALRQPGTRETSAMAVGVSPAG